MVLEIMANVEIVAGDVIGSVWRLRVDSCVLMCHF